MTAPLVSIVIPTYQRRESVKRALNALVRQSIASDCYEVVVSVDGSTDGTSEMLDTLCPPFRLHTVRSDMNHGRASACNRGVEKSCGEVVVVLDDDMEPASGFVEGHLQAHVGHERRGVVGAVPIRLGPSSRPVVRYVARKFNTHLENLARGIPIDGRAFYSGNFSVRRSVLLEIEGFDASFTLYGNEDVDLVLRLRSRGIDIVYSPAALAYQNYEKTMSAFARDQIAKGRTAVLVATKHPDAVSRTKLASYNRASRRWRFARAALVAGTRRFPRIVAAGIGVLERLDTRGSVRLERALPHLADYFFWLGVAGALPPRRRLRQAAGLAAETHS